MEEIKDILEYIDIKYNKQLFIDLFNKCEPIEPTKFLERNIKSSCKGT